MNLCAPLPLLPKFDLVLLRNVLLYFPQAGPQLRADRCVSHDASAWRALLLGNAEQAEDSTESVSRGVRAGLLLLQAARRGISVKTANQEQPGTACEATCIQQAATEMMPTGWRKERALG